MYLSWNRSILLTRRKRGTFKGETFASENQNTARLSGETEIVSEDRIRRGFWNFGKWSALLKWAVAGPVINDMLETAHLFESKPNEVYGHHEDTKLFQNKFHNDKKVFEETLENLKNPFLEQQH